MATIAELQSLKVEAIYEGAMHARKLVEIEQRLRHPQYVNNAPSWLIHRMLSDRKIHMDNRNTYRDLVKSYSRDLDNALKEFHHGHDHGH